MSFEESFLYPLILLAIGTGITYFLGTVLTQKYQDKQKKRDIEREDLHRSIAIKDDMIRQFSDTITILEKIVMSTFLLHEKDKTQNWVLVLTDDYNDFQSKTTKILLLLKLYFGESSIVYQEFSVYTILGLVIKNYALQEENQEREKLKNNVIRHLETLAPKNIPKVIKDSYMKELGIPDNFYTEITTKIGVWSGNFSQKILDTKLKTQN